MKRFLIIAGSEKCGTTSLFQYLSDSNIFNVSRKKETDFFRQTSKLTLDDYLLEFNSIDPIKPFLEASPGYLSESDIVAENMFSLLDDVHLVFCLRDPIERLKSNFLFRKSRLYIPENVDFNYYVEQCLKYENNEIYDKHLDEWSLSALKSGKYSEKLQGFSTLENATITIVTSDMLRKEPSECIKQIFDVIDINSTFFDDYKFGQNNITSGYKNKNIQRIALGLNKALESFWIKYPNIKTSLLSLYKTLNGAKKETILLREETESLLRDYYSSDLEDLKQKYNIHIASWL